MATVGVFDGGVVESPDFLWMFGLRKRLAAGQNDWWEVLTVHRVPSRTVDQSGIETVKNARRCQHAFPVLGQILVITTTNLPTRTKSVYRTTVLAKALFGPQH